MKNYFIANFIMLYISIFGFLRKAGYKSWCGLIPFFNIYLLFKTLNINFVVLFILIILLIFLPDKMLPLTFIYIFLPFIICHAYDCNTFIGILTLVFPFIMYPIIAFSVGVYNY